MVKHKRIRKAIIEYLDGVNEANTEEIFTRMKNKYPMNATMNSVANILARTKGIEKVGMYEDHNTSGGTRQRVRLAIWSKGPE